MRYYLDTSAAAKLVVNEAESEALIDYLDAAAERGDQLTSSLLLETETRRLAVQLDIAQSTITDLLARFDLLMPDRALYRDAGLLAGRDLRSLDALHVAAALRLNADALITYDARQRLAAHAVGLRTFAPV